MNRSHRFVFFAFVALSPIGCRVEAEPEHPRHHVERREVIVVEHEHGHHHDHEHEHEHD